jgi:hypothetical protein
MEDSMHTVTNLAAERARRDTERALDVVAAIRAELASDLCDQTVERLYDLAGQFTAIGITLLAATAVMAADFDQRIAKLGGKVGERRPCQQRRPAGSRH